MQVEDDGLRFDAAPTMADVLRHPPTTKTACWVCSGVWKTLGYRFRSILGLCRCGSRLEHRSVQRPSYRAADYRRYPEQPKLCQRPSSNKDSRPSTPCGVHREIRNRDSDQMNQRQSQSDCDGRKAGWCAPVRGSHNDKQEEEGQHHFRDKACHQGISSRRVRSVTVGRETPAHIETRLSAGDHLEDPGSGDSSDHLRDDVR